MPPTVDKGGFVAIKLGLWKEELTEIFALIGKIKTLIDEINVEMKTNAEVKAAFNAAFSGKPAAETKPSVDAVGGRYTSATDCHCAICTTLGARLDICREWNRRIDDAIARGCFNEDDEQAAGEFYYNNDALPCDGTLAELADGLHSQVRADYFDDVRYTIRAVEKRIQELS